VLDVRRQRDGADLMAKPCGTCGGTGVINAPDRQGNENWITCPTCGGSGTK
jgi:DnaJ-class molecular chaperone